MSNPEHIYAPAPTYVPSPEIQSHTHHPAEYQDDKKVASPSPWPHGAHPNAGNMYSKYPDPAATPFGFSHPQAYDAGMYYGDFQPPPPAASGPPPQQYGDEMQAWPAQMASGPSQPPPDAPGPPDVPLYPSRRRPGNNKVAWFWSFEIATLLSAFGLMGAIIGILAHFDGQKVPEWPFSINLNTLIALLSTLFRASMLVAVAEILGQIKWSWFSDRARPLHNLQDFDNASRSVIGSARLVGVVATSGRGGLGSTAGLLGFSAALVTILSFAVGPFIQQAIKTASCPQILDSVNATLPVANYVPGSSSYYRIAAGLWEVTVDMKGAMIQGLTNPKGNDSAIQAVCPSGNCTFPDYGTGITHSSIGMCSKCIDTTSLVSPPSRGGNLTLPDKDLFINAGSDQPWLNVQWSNLSWAQSLFNTVDGFTAAANAALMNVSVMALTMSSCSNATGTVVCPQNSTDNAASSYGGPTGYVATSCALYPCLKNYRGIVTGGVLNETVVSTVPAPMNYFETDQALSSILFNFTALKSPCILDNSGTWYTEANVSSAPKVPGRTWAKVNLNGANATVPNQCLYKLYGIYGRAMNAFMSGTLLDGSCDYNSRQGGELWCPKSWWLSPLYLEKNATFDSISGAFVDFTSALTNKFRMTGVGPDSMSRGANLASTQVFGIVGQTSVCIFFDWRWLVLPCWLVAASGLLLLWMMARNYEDPSLPVWKGSVLPLLFYGLQGRSVPQDIGVPGGVYVSPPREPSMAQVMNLSEVEALANGVMVKFRSDGDPGFSGPSDAAGHSRDYSLDSLLGGTRATAMESSPPPAGK
jgi:hypothetical protein